MGWRWEKVRARTGLIAAAVVIVALALVAGFLATRGGGGKTSATSPPATHTTAAGSTGGGGAAKPKEITLNIGLMVDKSGPTSGVGRPYAEGAEAAFKYFNEKGVYTRDGVRVKLNYIERDYGYNPTRAQQYYKEFRDQYHVAAIVGWGTADTEQLSSQVARDKILYISASYSAKLVPQPYNFFPAPDYSTQACAAVTWMAQKKPGATLVLMYDHTVAYSKSPIPAIKAMAEKLGLKVYDVNLPLRASDADAENAVQQASQHKPDFIWCGNTISSCSRAAKAMAKYGLNAVMVANVWGFDERFPQLAGGSSQLAGHVAGVSPWRWPEGMQDKPGYREVYEAAKMAGKKVNLRFMQGFMNVWLLVKAIERTDSKTLMEKKGEALKEALESSCNGQPIKLGDITPPMRYCPGSHLPFRSSYIVVWDGKSFKFEGPITPSGVDCVKVTNEAEK